jgi:mono/diheme cytochrome c family protein
MRHHFAEVIEIHDALVRGDLDAIRAPARTLTDLPLPMKIPATARRYVTAISDAARRVEDATTIGRAAAATVTMLRRCSDCHVAVGIRPMPSAIDRRSASTAPVMLEHQLAFDELLQGFVLPSQTRWDEGANRLRLATLQPSGAIPDAASTRNMASAEADVRVIAQRAVGLTDPGSQAHTYVQLLTRCAECHEAYRRGWEPGRGD